MRLDHMSARALMWITGGLGGGFPLPPGRVRE